MQGFYRLLSLCLCIGPFLCPCALTAQGQFVLSGEIRERGFYSHGYEKVLGPRERGVFWVGQRTRLGFEYENKDIGFFVQLEDGRVWGEAEGGRSYGFGIAQAWFHARFAQRFEIKLGRMPLVYENGRYMAYSGWDECGNPHDALKLRYQSLDGNTQAELSGSVSNNSESRILNPYGTDNYYKYLLVAYASRTFAPDFRWSLLSVTDFQEKHFEAFTDSSQSATETKVDPSRIFARSALGTYLDICPRRKVSALVYAYGQFGKDSYGRNVLAGMASAIVTCKVHPLFEIKAAYEYVSGNKHPEEDLPVNATDHAFDRFMGSSHSFLGIMDLFNCSGRDDLTLGAGYHQPYLTFTCFPAKDHTLSLNARYFWTADTPEPGLSNDLGLEMALTYKYKIRPDLTLDFGYAIHSRTRTLETLSGIEPGESKFPHFGYVMIAYKPIIFNSANHPKKDR